MLISVIQSNRSNKKYKAIFSDHPPVHFGSKFGFTYLDHKDIYKRFNYLKRHEAIENWMDPYSAGALSAYLLWGNNTNLSKNIYDFNILAYMV